MLAKDRFPTEIIDVCLLLSNHGFQAFVVGGSIRDIIQGNFLPQDWDIATDAKPSEVIGVFNKRFRVIPTGIKHGTVTILFNGLSIEITTFRVEGDYIDGRRPLEVHFVKKITDDLSRRDLTINAIAYDPIHDILSDPFNGIKDIEAGIIRMVGDPNKRLKEDGLRLIRIFRFVSQLGFNIDPPTSIAVTNNLTIFNKVAKERIHTEFQKLLQGAFFQKSILLLEDCGLLYHLIPEFNDAVLSKNVSEINLNRIELTLKIVSSLPSSSSQNLRFATLIHQLSAIPSKSSMIFPPFQENFIQKILKSMKCSNKQITTVSHILSIHLLRLPYSMQEEDDTKDYLIRKFQYKIQPEYLTDYLNFYYAKENILRKEKLLTELLKDDITKRARTQQPIELKDLALNGDDIIQFFLINKKYSSQREFIGLCLQIIRERVELNPQINLKGKLFTILENLNKILTQCTTQITRRVHIVSTDHIRKLYCNGVPKYVQWENEHTYLLSKWLIRCQLRKDTKSIVIFDGTNFNFPTHPTHREKLCIRFKQYNPIFINTSASEEEVKLNLETRNKEPSSIKKSDADLSIFRRYQDLLRTYPKALNILDGYDFIQLSTRHPEFLSLIQDITKRILKNKNRLVVMSGNVLTGKTYTAYILQKYLEGNK
ncbi:MAG: CCA tRNA nucleotidyltransferase [Promethearchaeota archaeon]